jgi:recombination protein RecA
MYGEGISRAGEVLDIAVDLNIVKKAGSWFSYDTDRLGQGRENVRQLIRDTPELLEELEAKILEAKGIDTGNTKTTAAEAQEEEA